MAEKISVQIALEGGAEVQRQLADIGEAGQKAFADISKSAEQVGGFSKLNPEEVTKKLKDLGIEGTAAFDKITKAVASAANLEKVVQGVQSVESAFVALGRAAGPIGLAVAAGLKAATTATIAFADAMSKASDQAVKLGQSLEGFKQAQKNLAQIGITGQAAAEGLKKMNEAAAQSKLDEVAKAANELKEAAGRGFGAQGTAQLKALQEAAKGFDEAGKAARKTLVELGEPIPTDAPKTLAELGGNLAAFRQQLAGMPDSLQRTNLAIASLGEKAGTALVQGLRAAEGSMSDAERKAYDLGQALQRLSQAGADFGSVQLAPALTAGIDAITGAVERLNARLQTNFWGTLAQGASLLNPVNAVVQGLISTVEALASKIASTDIWASFSQAAVTSWNQVVDAVSGAGDAISQFVSSITGISWDAISSAGVAAWNAITGAIQGAIDAVMKFIGLKPQAPASGGGAPGMAGGGLLGGRGTGTSDSNLAWLSRGEYVTPAGVVRQPGVLAFLEAMRRGGGIPGYADGGVVGGGGGLGSLSETLFQAGNAMHDALVQLGDNMRSIEQALRNTFTTVDTSMTRIQDTIFGVAFALRDLSRELSGNARGGLLGGRGTGTSDSNLAWVSRGEHIMPARAVAQPGVLAFLEALRRSGGNLRGVLDGMGRFALGGLVPRPALAFAGGGVVGAAAASRSLGTLTLVTADGVVSGLTDAKIAEALQRVAVKGQVSSGGRKPSRYS